MNLRRSLMLGVMLGMLAGTPHCFAEVNAQKDGLFWIDVPQGWSWSEGSQSVMIKKATGQEAILIKFQLYEKPLVAEDEDTMLQGARNSVIQEMASRGGKSVMKVQRKISGIPALHLGFLVPSPEGILQYTTIVFFNKGYYFNITCHSDREYKRLEMEKIIDTFSFQEPEKPKATQEEAGPVAVENISKENTGTPIE